MTSQIVEPGLRVLANGCEFSTEPCGPFYLVVFAGFIFSCTEVPVNLAHPICKSVRSTVLIFRGLPWQLGHPWTEVSSSGLSLTETSAQATWPRPKGWLRHTSEQLTNCSQLSGVKEFISEKWHFLILFLKRQARLLFLFTNSWLLYFEMASVVTVLSDSVSILAFFSDFTSIC